MPAKVIIEKMTDERGSYRYGKYMHFLFTPVDGENAVVADVRGLKIHCADLRFEEYAGRMLVHTGFKMRQGFFILSRGDSYIEVEITEESYTELAAAIKAYSPKSAEELAAERKAAFFQRLDKS